MSDLFVTRENKYRTFQALESSLKRTATFGTEIISYNRPPIWNFITERLRTTLNI